MDNLMNDMRRPIFGGLNSAAEFVTPGHPDKTCDQIAGKILDEALVIDPTARVAIEMLACNGKITIGGEVSDRLLRKIDVVKCTLEVFDQLGYHKNSFPVEVSDIINCQSHDISKGKGSGIDSKLQDGIIGAGDQGVMCGYAIFSPEREHMPAAFWLAQRLAMRLFEVANKKVIPDLYTDGKTQVIIRDGKINKVTIAIQHGKSWSDDMEKLKKEIVEKVVFPLTGYVEDVVVNGTGKFEIGSIWADAAEVGRKIVIDQMGPDVPVGGGTLNGKDPSKVDLTGAVMARYIAKNIVAHGLAHEALVQLAFTIGHEKPDQLNVYAPGWKLNITPEAWCDMNFDTTVSGMIRELCLDVPNGWSYELAAKFGFYGHVNFPWEKIKPIMGNILD